jgi:hypothetical protein
MGGPTVRWRIYVPHTNVEDVTTSTVRTIAGSDGW